MNRSFYALALCGLLVACGEDGTNTPTFTPGTGGDGGGNADAGATDDTGAMDDSGATDDTGGTEDGGASTDCTYPDFNGPITRGQVFPDFAWDAKLADGTDYTLDMVEFYCDDEKYGQYETMAFGVSTEWCGFCPQWQQYMDYFAEELEARGMLIVFSEVQNATGGPIDSARANQVINGHTDQGNGIRLGDADNIYEPNGLTNGQSADFFPTAFVIRRSDMQIIAHARDTANTIGAYLPFAEIAEDPTADWSNPPAATITPDIPQPEPNCGEEDEEELEAGDQFDSVVTIGEGTIEGGLCVDTFDYYFVDLEGAWSADLQFTHAVGDLDIYVLDEEGQQLIGDDGRPIGSESTDDNEFIEYEGPANIVVVGYQGATATYSLTISAL